MDQVIPSCFKAYDIRGRVPDELDEIRAEVIGRAFAAVYSLKKVVVGRDMRLSSERLSRALAAGLLSMGVDVIDIGLCGTEEIYHAAFSLEPEGVDGGVVVTASHNPADYNGMKFVTRGARPVTGESGLLEMGRMVGGLAALPEPTGGGRLETRDLREEYVNHLLASVDISQLPPLRIVANCGNGCAGLVLEKLAERLPVEFVILHGNPDGTFPNGVPNPLLVENRQETADSVLNHGADLGLGWDGDFDRCFFWDEKGRFIEGYYLVGLLATQMLKQEPGAKILYDPRLTWATEEVVGTAGGYPVMTRTGHAFIKERMRREDAIYGGEMSAHHYFRDFGYCDSGMLPWLLILKLLGETGAPLSSLVEARMAAFPVSGEINRRVDDADAVIEKIRVAYGDGKQDFVDGLSVAYPDYRFNVRKSNTEPLLRLNVESRGDRELMETKTRELLDLIEEG